MATRLEILEAWSAAQASGREVVAEQGLPRRVSDGAAVSLYEWSAGELASIVEPDGCRWNYGYGDDGRLLTVDKNGRRWADYTYDAAGRLASVRRPEQELTHSYDENGRLIRTLRGDASPFIYRWDGQRVISARSHREISHFHHDGAGRLVGIEQQVDGIGLTARFSFGETGLLARQEFPEWGQRLEFTWDTRGRPATVAWNGTVVARFGTDDELRLSWSESLDGMREETRHDAEGRGPTGKAMYLHGREIWRSDLVRDEAFRLVREGERTYAYDASGRLSEARDGDHGWQYHYDAMDNPLVEEAVGERDPAGRLRYSRQGTAERVFRHNQAGELQEVLKDGNLAARCLYDHKGRLILKSGPAGAERYFYGPDDGLLAVADGDGQPLMIFLRLPIGVVGVIDFRTDANGRPVCLHCDVHGDLVFAGSAGSSLEGPFASDPFGVPMRLPASIPFLYRGRLWHDDVGLYRMGCRWYDPSLRQFLTPDTYTGAPDDERLVNPFLNACDQRMARVQILGDWLRQPRLRNRHAYCANDPVNRIDPNGHWSFGGVLLSLLGVLWTLPNTALGLAIEVSCLLGEVLRWLVWLFSGGNASWQTPGFDAAASGRLNAFALIFKGGWFGSFLEAIDTFAITFGNVVFVNDNYPQHPWWKKQPDPVKPTAYKGAVSIPKSQALYEHELRHVNQYGWFGPFFNFGLPLFGVYEWDCILHGYANAELEKDARAHGGI